jgi:hypothetical protein
MEPTHLHTTSDRPEPIFDDVRPFHGIAVPYDACSHEQRPAPGLPHPAVLRLQVFSTS